MDIEVVPAAITQVDYPTFLRLVKPISLDEHLIEIQSLTGFLASILPVTANKNPRNAIRNTNYILRHISISFYLKCDERDLIDLRHYSKLVITQIQEELFLITGSLEDWKLTAIDMSNLSVTKKTRFIINCCVLYIEKAGLLEVFGNYSKQTLPDQTFIFHRKE